MKYARLIKRLSVDQLKAMLVAKGRMGKVDKLEREKKRLLRRLAKLDLRISRLSGENRRGGKRKISAAARKRMARAQRARWAKHRETQQAAS